MEEGAEYGKVRPVPPLRTPAFQHYLVPVNFISFIHGSTYGHEPMQQIVERTIKSY